MDRTKKMKLKILKFGLWRFETIYEVMKEINSYYGVHSSLKNHL